MRMSLANPRHLRHPRLCFVSLLACGLLCTASGQSGHAANAKQPSQLTDVRTFALDYSKPVTYALGSKTSSMTADFKSSSDGSVFVEMSSSDAPIRGFHICALRPAQQTVVYRDPQVDPHVDPHVQGLRHFGLPASYFVSANRTYVLRQAEAIDPSSPGQKGDTVSVVSVYDDQGEVLSTVRLEPGLNPVTVAAFGSGDLLAIAVDSLHPRARLLMIDSTGSTRGELRLFDEDYGARLASHRAGSPPNPDTLARMLSSAQLLPAGDNILIVPVRTRMPLLEINQHGVVRSTHLNVPAGMTISRLVPSDDGMLYVILGHSGHSGQDPSATSVKDQNTRDASAYVSDRYIYKFNPADGSLTGRIAYPLELVPVRRSGSDFLFLGVRADDGRYQVVKATVAH